MKIAVGNDHIAFDLKEKVVGYLKELGHEVIDVGCHDNSRTHYPIFGHKCAIAVTSKKADLGIVMCGTGIGIINAANKTKGARAVLVNSPTGAYQAKIHYNANIIGIGSQVTGPGLAFHIIEKFLKTKYVPSAGRKKIINFIDNVIKNENYQEEIFDKELKKWDKNEYHD